MKKSSSTKKVGSTTTSTTSTKAPGTDRPSSSKTTTSKPTTTTTKSTTTKTTTVKSTATAPQTPKVPATPKTPKPPATPKTPKAANPPATPKTPKPATARPSTAKPTTTTTAKPAAKRPATATTARPASAKPAATAKPTTKTTTASRPTTATSRPATAKAAASSSSASGTTNAKDAKVPSSGAGSTKLTKSGSAKLVKNESSTLVKSESAKLVKSGSSKMVKSGSAKAVGDAGKSATASTSRPGTSTAPKLPASTVPKLATSTVRPATSTATKKATTPRDSSQSTAKSPRTPGRDSASAGSKVDVPQKSPRHIANVGKANTISDLLTTEVAANRLPPHLSATNRSVSVGANLTRAAPAGRRKPTANPVKSRQAITQSKQTSPRQRAAAGLFGGMGVLASVGDGEFGQVQLRKVADDKPKVLLIHVKGRRNVVARAAEVSHKSLNKGDAFVLVDAAMRKIYEWRGASANKMEIARAMDIAGRIKNKEFSGRADMFVLEDGKNDQNPEFWFLLGGKGTIAPATVCAEDEDEDKIVRQDFFYGIAEKVQGKPEAVLIAKHKFYKDMLQSGQVYVLDCVTELYMWVGKGCPSTHRTLIAAKAQDVLVASKTRPKWVTITRVIEGAEPEIFKEKFCDWPSTLPITMAAVPKGNVAGKVAVKFDVASMFVHAKRDDKVIDDGSGKIEIWRVKDHTKEPVEQNMYGQFFDSESYVILYKYMIKNREVFIIYFWQGKKSSITEKGSSALLTIDLDDSIGGSATQVRVVQNKEPKHFMKLFGGFIVVHKPIETEDGASAIPETALYQIRGCNQVEGGCDVRAVQLASPSAKYLNTNDTFLLNTSEKQYIWIGANSSKFMVIPETTLAELGNSIRGSREQVFIREGEEPAVFWENVGAAEYYKTAWKWMPRLFHCSSASGAFKIEEVVEWDQEDLDPGHLNIVDTSHDVFLWTGQRASLEEEKKQAMESVLEYAKLHPTRKLEEGNADDVLCINALREPFKFKSLFHCWDDSKSKFDGENNTVRVADLLKELSRPYTLAELRNPPKMLDSSKLESYLSVEEFSAVFKMDKEAFAAQPLWKQEQQKKNVGLY